MDDAIILDTPQTAPTAPVETFEVVEIPVDPPFLEKPFNEYTTTEGLLFCILFFMLLSGLWSFIKEAF